MIKDFLKVTKSPVKAVRYDGNNYERIAEMVSFELDSNVTEVCVEVNGKLEPIVLVQFLREGREETKLRKFTVRVGQYFVVNSRGYSVMDEEKFEKNYEEV